MLRRAGPCILTGSFIGAFFALPCYRDRQSVRVSSNSKAKSL